MDQHTTQEPTYEAPVVEDIEVAESPASTAAGIVSGPA
jgi:hypothetical protein